MSYVLLLSTCLSVVLVTWLAICLFGYAYLSVCLPASLQFWLLSYFGFLLQLNTFLAVLHFPVLPVKQVFINDRHGSKTINTLKISKFLLSTILYLSPNLKSQINLDSKILGTPTILLIRSHETWVRRWKCNYSNSLLKKRIFFEPRCFTQFTMYSSVIEQTLFSEIRLY